MRRRGGEDCAMQMMSQKGRSHRGQRTLKLLNSVQGEGMVLVGDASAAVVYHMDTFEERNRQSVGGSLEGDISFAEDKSAAILKLADGHSLKILLVKPDAEGADFQGV